MKIENIWTFFDFQKWLHILHYCSHSCQNHISRLIWKITKIKNYSKTAKRVRNHLFFKFEEKKNIHSFFKLCCYETKLLLYYENYVIVLFYKSSLVFNYYQYHAMSSDPSFSHSRSSLFFLCIFFFKNDCSLVGECYTGTNLYFPTPSVI